MKSTGRPNDEAASANITNRIQKLADWRGETLAYVRQLIPVRSALSTDSQEEVVPVQPCPILP